MPTEQGSSRTAGPYGGHACGEASAPTPSRQQANPHYLPKSSQAEEAQVDVLGAGSSTLAQMAQTQLLIAQMMAIARQ